jgi:WD40 repeat protein
MARHVRKLAGALVERAVLRSMFATRLALAATLVFAVGLLGTSMGAFAYQVSIAEQAEAETQQIKNPSAQEKPSPSPALARTDQDGDPLPAGAISRLGTVRLRHGSVIHCVSFAPNGKLLATALDHCVCIWDRASGQLMAVLQANRGKSGQLDYYLSRLRLRLTCVVFSPNGKLVAAGDDRGGVRLWDWQADREILSFKSHDDAVETLAFAPDGKTLATGGWTQAIYLWETATGKEVRRLRGEDRVYRLAFSPDGKVLACGGLDSTVVWDLSTGRELCTLAVTANAIQSLGFSPDGKLLAFGTRGRGVDVWDWRQGRQLRVLQVPFRWVFSVAFAPDGKVLAAAGGEYGERWDENRGGIVLFDVNTGNVVHRLGGDRHPFESIAFSGDGKVLAGVGGHDHTVHLWDATTGREVTPGSGHRHFVTDVTIAADGRTVATAAADGTVRLWDALTGKELRRFAGSRGWLSQDGQTLLTVVDDTELSLHGWSAVTGQEHWRHAVPQANADAIAVAADRRTVALQVTGHAIGLVAADTGKEHTRLQGHREPLACLAFSPDGKALASAGHNEKGVRLWASATGKELRRFDATASSLAISPDGGRLAADSDEGLRLWETADGQEVVRFRFREHGMYWAYRGYNISFSPDGRTLAGGGRDGQIRLWETATGELRRVLKGHLGWVGIPAFSSDGRLLVTGSSDTTALVWDLRNAVTPTGPLSQERLMSLWDNLISENGAKSYEAIVTLSAAPEQSVPFLKRMLRPVARVDKQRLAQLMRELDADDARTCQQAAEELEKQAEVAGPTLREALPGFSSVELRWRVEGLVAKWDPLVPRGERLRARRALEVLEQAATPEAKQVLRTIAEGEPVARLTRDAQASLERLDKRPSVGP